MRKQYSHVFIDESGDLGRSERSTRYLVVASIATSDSRKVEKAVRKVWTTKQHKKHAGELHAIYASESTRFKLLTLLEGLDIEIRVTVVDKVAYSADLHKKYYEMLAELVAKYKKSKVIVIDKRDTTKKRNEILNQLKLLDVFKEVQFSDSRAVRQLQAVDFACWSIFQALENNNQRYLEAIKSKLKESLPL